MRHRILLLLAFLISLTNSAIAQGPRTEQRFDGDITRVASIQPPTDRVPTSHLAMAGVLGMVGGFFGGALLGAKFFGDRCANENPDDSLACEWAPLAGGIVGAMVGEAVLIPISVHLANKRKGSLLQELLVSAGLGALGAAMVFGDEDAGILVGLVGVPVVQIGLTIAQERNAEDR